jgi:putative ABC transport system permease protein
MLSPQLCTAVIVEHGVLIKYIKRNIQSSMISIALKMLFGDKVKLLGLVAGIAFSTLLMAQQGGFFIGLISRSANLVIDARDVSIWVMDPLTETAEGPRAMRDTELSRVRGVPGVAWAVPLVQATATLRTNEGRSTSAAFLGVDDASLVGINRAFVAGSPEDLRGPDAIAIDQLGFARLWPGEPIKPGKVIEVNERRAVVVAITNASPGFAAPVVVYTRLTQALAYTPGGRNRLSFVLASHSPGLKPADVARDISAQTGLKALTSDDFRGATIDYVIRNTGIAFSFGVVIGLGAIVGILVAGLTFTLFISENIRQFAVLKAVGTSNWRILGMVASQAAVVAFIGYGFGLGLASGFFEGVNQPLSELKGFWLPWQIAAMVAAATLVIVLLASVVSLRRVLQLDPAVVFRG